MEKEYTSIREALSGSLQDCIPRFFILMAENGGWKTDTILGTRRRLLIDHDPSLVKECTVGRPEAAGNQSISWGFSTMKISTLLFKKELPDGECLSVV